MLLINGMFGTLRHYDELADRLADEAGFQARPQGPSGRRMPSLPNSCAHPTPAPPNRCPTTAHLPPLTTTTTAKPRSPAMQVMTFNFRHVGASRQGPDERVTPNQRSELLAADSLALIEAKWPGSEPVHLYGA